MFRVESSMLSTLAVLVVLAVASSVDASVVHASLYDIDVRIVPHESRLEASAVIGLRESGEAAGTARFWLHGELRVSEITAGGQALEYAQRRELYSGDYSLVGNRVEFELPGGKVPERIEVKWSGTFHPSKARSPSDYMRIDGSGVFLRAFGYSPWFPIFLEEGEDEHNADFTRVVIEVPAELTAVFAGALEGIANEGETTRYTWSAISLPLHAAQLTARPFVVTTREPLSVYSLGDQTSIAAGKQIVDLARSLLEYFRAHYRQDAVAGSVHIVEMPEFGDISSGNLVGIQEERWRSFAESEGAKRTLAHELVHPFVQPAISRTDPLYAMAIESFPSYFHYPALDALGETEYDERISTIRAGYLEKKKTGKGRRGRALPEEKPISLIGPDEIGVYKDTFILSDRAVLFLHELRARMGKERFDEFGRELFALKRLDESGFRALVLEYLPDFEAELTTWLDRVDLPEGFTR